MIARTAVSAALSDHCADSAPKGVKILGAPKIGEARLTRGAKPAPFHCGVGTPKASPRAELVLMELATDYERLRGPWMIVASTRRSRTSRR